jgi:hypothetical protein
MDLIVERKLPMRPAGPPAAGAGDAMKEFEK